LWLIIEASIVGFTYFFCGEIIRLIISVNEHNFSLTECHVYT
jgi:hypothetical protein